VVTLIPFGLGQATARQISELSESLRDDLGVIQSTLRLRYPVTALVIGIDRDSGFGELVQRLDPGLLTGRLGGRFDVQKLPTPEELNEHSDKICDAFEEWLYRLFRQEGALARQRGNRKLYGFLSRIRNQLKPNLRTFLGKAFGCEPSEGTGESSFFFSGCYFAGSDLSLGNAAFVRGVLFDKLIQEQGQVEWTGAALRVHRWLKVFGLLGWTLCFVLSVTVTWLVFR
jgi:type VI protein secretion system component VasK